jgi:redox-sensing transcriptional repressor
VSPLVAALADHRSEVSSPRPPRPHGTGARPSRGIPEATVARLPVYLRALTTLADRGIATASSEELARAAGVNSAKLRKDLSYLGSYGTRGVGYDVEYLRYQIAREIGLTQDWPVVIVGIGNLGHALANYSGFASRGFGIVGLLDADPARVGERIGEHVVKAYSELESVVQDYGVAIGVIATPATAAQEVCDRMVAAGITSVLNFAPTVLNVPPGVDVRKVDLSTELQILAYHEQRKAVSTPGRLTRIDGVPLDNGRAPGHGGSAVEPATLPVDAEPELASASEHPGDNEQPPENELSAERGPLIP